MAKKSKNPLFIEEKQTVLSSHGSGCKTGHARECQTVCGAWVRG